MAMLVMAAGYGGADVMNEWIAPLICEFIGPLALTFVGAGSIIMTQSSPDLVAVALAHGLAIGLFVAAAGHISGGA